MNPSEIKAIAKDWLPPALVRLLRPGRRRHEIRFEGDYPSWADAAARCSGYGEDHILAKVLEATLKVKRGEAACERDSVLFDEIQYSWPVLAGLMWVAARHGGTLSVLDFGGALGSSYFQNKLFLEGLSPLRWSVVEQAHYVDAGREHIQDEHLRFYHTIEECLREHPANVILLSSVLQYLPDPFALIDELSSTDADAIIVDRTVVNQTGETKVYVQHVPESIYRASYPCWSISEQKLTSSLGPNYSLLASFPSLDFPALSGIASLFKGYIFRKAAL